jgi:hypothetical protein
MSLITDTIHFLGGALMQTRMLVLAISLVVLCGGESLFVANQAYGYCTGCCVCLYGGGYKYCSGCTPPGGQYGGITCPVCAVSDPGAIQANMPSYNSPSGMRAVRELSLPSIRRLDSDEMSTFIRGGPCLRRSTELRLLGNPGEGFGLHGQNRFEQPVQFQVATQAD